MCNPGRHVALAKCLASVSYIFFTHQIHQPDPCLSVLVAFFMMFIYICSRAYSNEQNLQKKIWWLCVVSRPLHLFNFSLSKQYSLFHQRIFHTFIWVLHIRNMIAVVLFPVMLDVNLRYTSEDQNLDEVFLLSPLSKTSSVCVCIYWQVYEPINQTKMSFVLFVITLYCIVFVGVQTKSSS